MAWRPHAAVAAFSLVVSSDGAALTESTLPTHGEGVGEAFRPGEAAVTAQDRMSRPAGAMIEADVIAPFEKPKLDHAGFRAIGAPSGIGFAWLRWSPAERAVATPNLEAWSGLWTYPVVPPPVIVDTGAILARAEVETALTPSADLIFRTRRWRFRLDGRARF